MEQVVKFANDDEAPYRSWLAANRSGYVVNERSHGKYLVLHVAKSDACINQPGKRHTSSRALSAKICGFDRAEVEAYCLEHFKRKPDPCGKCVG
jgi:hypothetical protein